MENDLITWEKEKVLENNMQKDMQNDVQKNAQKDTQKEPKKQTIEYMQAIKCLIFQEGLIYLVDNNHLRNLENLRTEDISVSSTKNGIAIILKNYMVLPIPEELLDYIIDNRNITLYTFSAENYIEEPVITFSLSKNALIEARSIFKFLKFHDQAI